MRHKKKYFSNFCAQTFRTHIVSLTLSVDSHLNFKSLILSCLEQLAVCWVCVCIICNVFVLKSFGFTWFLPSHHFSPNPSSSSSSSSQTLWETVDITSVAQTLCLTTLYTMLVFVNIFLTLHCMCLCAKKTRFSPSDNNKTNTEEEMRHKACLRRIVRMEVVYYSFYRKVSTWELT